MNANQAPLLLDNLAQHLNNPPAPQAGYATTSSPQSGGKLLMLPNGAAPPAGSEEEKIYILLTELLDPETRETALLELSKKREMYEDLALVLWGGFGAYIAKIRCNDLTNRHPVVAVAGDCQRLPGTLSAKSHRARL
jgi:CCR4-NOT transcription complex subunit 9